MNKKLLAVAIAGAFAAPVAMADTSNVVIYGVINMSYDNVDGGTGSAATSESRSRISSNNSNLGFKGTEDLGNGLSAIWQFESAISFDQQIRNDQAASDTGGATGSRNTFAGFSSKTLGNLTFGNQESPMKTSINKLDLFANTIADYRTLIATQVRMANSVLYASPSFNGFDAKLGYSARNEAGNDTATGSVSNPSYWSGSVTYANGPILAAVAYEQSKDYAAFTSPTTTATVTTATYGKQTTTRAGFGYNFGVAKVGLGYNTTKINANTTVQAGSAGAITTTSGDSKVNSWLLSGAYIMGKTTLKAQYVKSGDTSGNDTSATASSQGAKQWSLGADYTLSKRTSLYALYTTLKNDTNSSRTLGGNATVLGASTGIATVSAASSGADPRAISVGFVHSF